MNDDDIPLLTKVVRRERRAELTLTEDRRAAIINDVTQATNLALNDMFDETAEQLRIVLQETLLMRLAEALPTIIENVLQQHIDSLESENKTS